MARNRVYPRLLIIFAMLSMVQLLCRAQATTENVRRPFVLVLHSYSPSPRDNSLQEGINQELVGPARIDLYVDYMDSRKLETPEYLDELRRLLIIKYQHIKFDLVIVCDNNAYQFALHHRQELWPGVPIVFCGVKELRPQEFAGQENFTGITENADLTAFVASFPAIVPGLQKLLIIRDDSPYVHDILPHILDALNAKIPAVKLEFLENLSAEEMAARLQRAEPGTAVFYLSFWREKNGRFINADEGYRILKRARVPVFSIHEAQVGNGALGSCFTDAYAQGAAAGKVGFRILSGTPAGTIPAVVGPPRRILFDYPALQRFGVSRAALPPGSQIANEPFSFYREYRRLVWATLGIITLLSTLVVLLVTNVMQRRRAIAGLMESERKFQTIFDQTSDAIFIHEMPEGRLVDVNEAMLKLFGYASKAEALTCAPEQMAHDQSPHSLNEARILLRRAEEEGPQTFEWLARRKTGELFWVEVALRSSNIGGRRCVLAAVRDIAERKRAEEEKEKLRSQLDQAQKMESVGRLAGGVAHDFNNMLQVILGNTAMAMECSATGTPVRDYLEEIQKSSKRSADLTRQLLAFARRQTIQPKVFDLNAAVTEMVKMLRRLIGESIHLAWGPGPDLWRVKMDPSQLDQVLTNLCVNARDAMVGAGKITIATENVTLDDAYARSHPDGVPGDYVLLSVGDSGRGMDEYTRAHLFEPFYTTKELGKGTGLGLATVYGIVKQNQGLIDVESEPGKGTTIKIYLPRERAGAVPVEQDPVRELLRGSETVLLVEDEEQILNLSQRILHQQGYTVLTASTPQAAMDLAARHAGPLHLLVTDVVMPGMNGKELRDKLRVSHPGLKCLFISGYTADVIAGNGVLDDGVHFLQKPFTIQALVENVRSLCSRTPS